MIVQDLWQVHYQILLIISQKEFRACDYFPDIFLIKHKCLSCNKYYSNKLDEKLKKRFKNTFRFSDSDINKFILLLRKGFYPYEYMDEWESLMKQHYLKKKNFIAT